MKGLSYYFYNLSYSASSIVEPLNTYSFVQHAIISKLSI